MIRALRWLLVAPMAALGWIIAFTAALATHSLIDTYCPEQYKVSNACTWEWATLTQDLLIVVGATISAVLFVSFATVTAPAYKSRVATAAFLVGLSAATWAFLQTSALSAFIGACAGGLVTLLITLKYHGRRKVSGYRQYQLFV
jgi:hypothetical protein